MALLQFVTFKINDNLLGIDILKVREINRILDITPVQHAPDYIRGLINLRGRTVTVFDLGVRLGLDRRVITEASHNVVLKHEMVGLLVDEIGHVAQAEEKEIELSPANVGGVEEMFISGVVKLDKELLALLSVDKLLEYKVQKRNVT
ncbi:MAG: chemotaxis protein CheW [Desulfobacterales bacterium]|nr:chemotaxis protein CheW [Desulfobacterales bacterium]